MCSPQLRDNLPVKENWDEGFYPGMLKFGCHFGDNLSDERLGGGSRATRSSAVSVPDLWAPVGGAVWFG